jgi:imidazolonepropionase-like amidohydrolase
MNCVEAGVLSVEHGNFLDEESASLMKERGMFLVPTLGIIDVRIRHGIKDGASEASLEKFRLVKSAGPQGLEVAMAAGVKIGSGSDVSGPYSQYRALELEIKASIMGPMASLISATRTNAELMGIDNDVGTLEVGKLADLILVDGNPIDDTSVLQQAENISLVMQSGSLVKNDL